MKKLLSILLCLCLTILPLNAFAAETANTQVINVPDNITNTTETENVSSETPYENVTDIPNSTVKSEDTVIDTLPQDDGTTTTPLYSTPEEQAIEKIIAYKKANGEKIPDETRAQVTGIVNNGVYYIKNYFSGKYLNVHYGVDANGTNVYQWTKDNSTEQKFKAVYDNNYDCYRLYAMCSSNGNNRVLDVVKNSNPLASGQNVDIWTPIDPTAQRLRLTYLIDGLYHIHMENKPELYFTTKDSSNGTGSGKSASSAGNVFIQTFNVNDNQQWKFEYLYTDDSDPSIPEGAIDSVNSNRIKGWAWRSDKQNEPINVKIKIVGANGVTYLNTNISANEYHNASYNSNYGNGYHGFSYNLYQLNLPSQTYTIYAYGIGDNNSLTQLANSPYELSYDSTVEVSFTEVPQIDERWCWAACAVMLGHNAYPNSVVTKEDVVQEIWGDLENSGGGFSAEVAAGAEFASQYNASFTVSEPLSFLEMRDLLNSGYLIHINIQYNAGAHAMIIHKCETLIDNGVEVEKVHIYDPDEDHSYSEFYSNLSKQYETYVNSVHIVI